MKIRLNLTSKYIPGLLPVGAYKLHQALVEYFPGRRVDLHAGAVRIKEPSHLVIDPCEPSEITAFLLVVEKFAQAWLIEEIVQIA